MSARGDSADAAVVASSLLTMADVAGHLNVSVRTVRREIADGQLRAASVRGRLRISVEDLHAYIRARADAVALKVSDSKAAITRMDRNAQQLVAQAMDRWERASVPPSPPGKRSSWICPARDEGAATTRAARSKRRR